MLNYHSFFEVLKYNYLINSLHHLLIFIFMLSISVIDLLNYLYHHYLFQFYKLTIIIFDYFIPSIVEVNFYDFIELIVIIKIISTFFQYVGN